jgi:glycosyltransferase involved in cell wall biosynthesis
MTSNVARRGEYLSLVNVTVVVATRNRCAELLQTLPRHEAQVVVVDNGSTDDTVSAVRRDLPNVTVVPLWDNHGAFARTIGARMATTDYIAFADNDSLVGTRVVAACGCTLRRPPSVGSARRSHPRRSWADG